MKLLLDQNLSFRLVPRLHRSFPESKHVKDYGLTGDDDDAIWRLAADQGMVIVTKDSDFFNRSVLRGHPPKVIQLSLGNCSTDRVFQVLSQAEDVIKEFGETPTESLLVLE